MEKLREGIVALVKRSAAKFEEMKGIQARIDRLAEELAKQAGDDRREGLRPQKDTERQRRS